MPDSKVQGQEPLGQKIWLIVLDKFLLAGLIVVFGGAATFSSTFFADRLKTVWAFQEKIFDKRFEAYSELQPLVDKILQTLAIYYNAPNDPENPFAFEPWPNTLDKLQSRSEALSDTGPGSGVGTDYFWTGSIYDIFGPLKDLLDTKQRHALLIPVTLDNAFNKYIKSVTRGIEIALNFDERKKEVSEEQRKAVDKQMWEEIFSAYRELRAHLRATLGLDLTPTNIISM